MEPVSSLIIAVALLVPAAPTRRLIWDKSSETEPKGLRVEKKYTSRPLLPGAIAPATSHILYTADVMPTLSAREPLKRETKAYSTLKAGWDGPDSLPPSVLSMETALHLIDVLPARLPLPRPMLSFNGELGLYWDLHGGYAELSFETGGQISFFSRDATGLEHFEENLARTTCSQSWFWGAIGHLDTPLLAAA